MSESTVSEDELTSLNTWDYVRQQRDRLTVEEVEYPILDGLEGTWQLISSDYGELIQRDDDEKTSQSPLTAFLFYIEMGFYPPPEVLLSVRACFERYFNFEGEVELEDVFFGPKKRGTGNYAARKGKRRLYLHFHFNCTLPNQKKSKQKIAQDMFDNLGIENIDVDTFLRNYRRWLAGTTSKLKKDK